MNSKDLLSATVLLAFVFSIAQATEITIYEDGKSMIRESRRVDVKSGTNTIYLEDFPQGIDRTSLKVEIPGKGIKLIERVFEFNLVSPDIALEKSIGKKVEVVCDNGSAHAGELVCFDAGNVVIRDGFGRILTLTRSHLSEMRLPDIIEGMLTRPRLKLAAESSVSGNAYVDLTYLTTGIGWQAVYMGEVAIDEKTIFVSGWTLISNTCGTDYNDCEIKLVSGSVRKVRRTYATRDVMGIEAAMAPGGLVETPFFEYHEYRLDRKASLSNQTMSQFDLFRPTQVVCSKQFVYDQEKSDRVQVTIEFENTKDAGLGLPLPAGRFMVFKKDSEGRSGFVGEDNIPHIARGEKVRLYVGDAFDLEAKREQIDYTRISDRIVEETFRITLTNHKDEDVSIRVVERIYGDWQITQSSLPSKKVRSDQIEFEADLPANGESVITYTVRRKP
ncbi:MAG: DUF4139 domain-containing protein [bacterium]